MSTTLRVEGMTCSHCVEHVRSALAALPGVTSVLVSLADGTAVVEHDESVTRPAMAAAVAEEGYAVTA